MLKASMIDEQVTTTGQTSFLYKPRRSILIGRYTAKINDYQVKLASVLVAYALLRERYQELHTN